MTSLFRLLVTLTLAAVVSGASPVCHQERTPGAPYPNSLITDTLHNIIATPKNGVCSGAFPLLPNGSKKLSVRRSNGSLVLEATRHSQNVVLGKDCATTFASIVKLCIAQSFWGGNVTVNGVDYSIVNTAYPKNWVPESSSPAASSPKVQLSSHNTAPPLPKATPPPHKVVPTSKATGKKVPASKTPASAKKFEASSTAVATTGSAAYRTVTLSGVTGKSGSFSQTKTTNKAGFVTTLPIWFGAGGAALLLLSVAGIAKGLPAPPPPEGLPAVHIGPDGQASLDNQQNGPSRTHNFPESSPTPSSSSVRSISSSDRNSISSSSRVSSSSRGSSSSRVSRSSRSSDTSSSASPSASAIWYMILPKYPLQDNSPFTQELKDKFETALRVVTNHDLGGVFWQAPLSLAEANAYRQDPRVRGVAADTPISLLESPLQLQQTPPAGPNNTPPTARSLEEEVAESDHLRERALIQKRRAVWELVQISTPENLPSNGNYAYDDSAGAGSNIYIFDSGLKTLMNPDLSTRGNRWLFPAGYPGDRVKDDAQNDPDGHGTCIVSKAIGTMYGVAKKSSVTVVKFPEKFYGFSPSLSPSVLLNGLSMILDDVIEQGIEKNVLIIAWSVILSEEAPDLRILYFQLLQALVNRGVIIVCAAGNDGQGRISNADGFPAVFVSQLPIIVVGSVDAGGVTDESTTGPPVTVWAPGVKVTCESGSPFYPQRNRIVTGTSFAAPMVAGLAAYLLSEPQFTADLSGGPTTLAEKMKNLIVSLAYIRTPTGNPVIFNGIQDDTACVQPPPPPPNTPRESSVAPPAQPPPSIIGKRAYCSQSISPASISSQAAVIVSYISHNGLGPSSSHAPPARPSPTPSAPALDCPLCKEQCAAITSRCAAVCVLPVNIGAGDACGPCLTAARANGTCVDCGPPCFHGKPNTPDCVPWDQDTCTDQYGAVGLCTIKGFGKTLATGGGIPCPAGLECDLAVSDLPGCAPAPGPSRKRSRFGSPGVW